MSKVRYMHLRRPQFDGITITEDREQRNKWHPRGGLTVAWVEEAGKLLCGFARCNDEDLYCKAIGRRIAQSGSLALNALIDWHSNDESQQEAILNYVLRNKQLRKNLMPVWVWR